LSCHGEALLETAKKPMLQKLRPHIAACLERAADCRRRALEAEDPARQQELLDFERTWLHLARSYEFVESLERFLLDGARSRPVENRDDKAPSDPA
jgi:hypothetical protein